MKKILYFLIPLVLVGLMVAKLVTNKQIAEERVYLYDREQPVQVTAIQVSRSIVQPVYTFTGTFESNKETKLSAEVQGKVNRVMIENGATVRKGQVLIQLDDALLQWQLKAAEIQVKGLEADLKRYRVLVENEAIQGIQLEKTELALETERYRLAPYRSRSTKPRSGHPLMESLPPNLQRKVISPLPENPCCNSPISNNSSWEFKYRKKILRFLNWVKAMRLAFRPFPWKSTVRST